MERVNGFSILEAAVSRVRAKIAALTDQESNDLAVHNLIEDHVLFPSFEAYAEYIAKGPVKTQIVGQTPYGVNVLEFRVEDTLHLIAPVRISSMDEDYRASTVAILEGPHSHWNPTTYSVRA